MQGNKPSWLCRVCNEKFFSPCLDNRPCLMDYGYQIAEKDVGDNQDLRKFWKPIHNKKFPRQERLF